ncbi:sodium- and chloride-dependent GABA transporter 2-like [Clavelina lepadiformis]|uniref:sodium- and chloride-dependent GABA transporter 2-like n=1 Tax=Clavelina lepadiformis TaxID=159417 RepID=UPI004042B1F9
MISSSGDTDKDVVTKTTKVERQTWSKPWDFLISSAGLSIGLGNIWRFPYLCFKYGGGAFLIPYMLSIVLLAIPLLMLEVSLGQSVRKGVIASWATVPLFKGISLAAGMLMIHSNISYPVILAWVLKYLVSCFSRNLPWVSCDNEWNTEHCVSYKQASHENQTNNLLNVSTIVRQATNETGNLFQMSSAEEFWNYGVLGISKGLNHVGSLRADLVLYLAVIWILGYLATFKGIKWSAKVVYFTATVPIILIIIVTIKGATVEGASVGIYYYLKPDMTKLRNPEVWIGAATQVLYSYGLCGAGMITMGSYNKYHQNFIRDVIIFTVSNGFASFLCGFAVFSTLGSMAFYQNLTMVEVVQSGPGLVFIAYPQALTLLPLPQLWNAIFFLTLLLLGLDSQFVYMESFCALFMDFSVRLREFHKYSREIFLALCNIGFFLVGLSCVTEGGIYVFEIFNTYGVAGWCLFFIAACEFVAVGWVYGASHYWKQINRMIGPSKLQPVVTFIWKFFGPSICLAVSVYYVAAHTPLTVGSYVYPPWAQVICHLVSASSAVWIPLYAFYLVATSKKSLSQLRRKEKNKITNISLTSTDEKEMMI